MTSLRTAGLLALTLVLLQLPRLPLGQRLEWLLYDARLAVAGRCFPERVRLDPRVLVVGITPECNRQISDHWVFWLPHYVRVARRALENGARVVGLDLLPTYAEPQALGEFFQLQQDFPGRLVLIAYWDGEKELTLPENRLVMALGVQHLALANLSLDQDAVARAQSVEPLPLKRHGREAWPFLGAELALRGGARQIRASAGQGRAYTNLSPKAIRSLPFYRVLQGQVERAAFADAVVLIGSHSKVDQDLVQTPRADGRPGSLTSSGFGVDYQAQVVNTQLTGQHLRDLPALTSGALLGLHLLAGLKVASLSGLALPLAGLAGLCALWSGLALGLLAQGGWLLPLAPGLLGIPLCWGAAMAHQSWLQQQARQKLHRTIAGYVAPEILREMLAEPDSWLRSLNQRRDVTVLFSDINQFSTVSERESPERVARWLNEHYQEMAHIIFKFQGTIIRFVGDQFMVLFGSPKSLPHPEKAAVLTALAMHERLGQLQSRGQEGFYHVKIGIHCGSMLLAVLGDDLKREYTAIGDEANLAARIQDLCKQVGQSTLVSQDIVDRIGQVPELRFTPQGTWEVKGREHPVTVYSVEAQSDCNPPEPNSTGHEYVDATDDR